MPARPRREPQPGRARCRDRSEARQGPRSRGHRPHPVRERCGVGDAIVAGTAYGGSCDARRDTARSSTRRGRRVRCRCRVSRAFRAPLQTFLVTEDDAPRARSPRSAKPCSATRSSRRRASASRSKASPGRSKRARSSPLNLNIKGDVSGAVEALEEALLRSTSTTRSSSASSTAVWVRSPSRMSTSPPSTTRSSSASTSARTSRPASVPRARASTSASTRYLLRAGRHRAVPQGHAQARVRREAVGCRRDPRGVRSSKFGNIAGVIVRSGTITRNAKARVIRDGVVLADGSRSSRCALQG